ncbi:hypothetical protein Q5P01_018472 [Channa striata]|uniref:Uncharacterized protein n=1 Tax=Channa striata TaxID=64152 RepID=A0AA88S958_CHASR|nr:hypothetical protein Q5P01_018472 [Channa striata]
MGIFPICDQSPSGTREKRAASQMGGPHQMGSRGYGAKRFEGRGKRLLAWQPRKQQGLPHSMDVVHGLVSFSDWRAEERRKGPSKEAFLSQSTSLKGRPTHMWPADELGGTV